MKFRTSSFLIFFNLTVCTLAWLNFKSSKFFINKFLLNELAVVDSYSVDIRQNQNSNLARYSLFPCAFALTVLTLSIMSGPAYAAVGEGDLPDGALAFSRILKFQSDWKKVAERVQKESQNMDQSEKFNTQMFLKNLANEYDDMETLMKGITDKTKLTSAETISKSFKAKIRECDVALGKGSLDKVIEYYPETSAELVEFLDLLKDVPDEL